VTFRTQTVLHGSEWMIIRQVRLLVAQSKMLCQMVENMQSSQAASL